MTKSLFVRIGGKAAVQATVLKMYSKILDDDALAPFFENIDVDKLRLSQLAFVTYAFGGPNHYTGKSLRQAHAGAVSNGMNATHFDRVVAHLKSAMEDLNVPTDLINEALRIVGGTRSDILGL